MSLARIRKRVPAVYHGWLVVAGAFVIALFSWGVGFYGPGIYLVVLRERYGLSTSEISSAITTYYLLGATFVFFTGGIFERFGARWVVAVGSLAMAVGVNILLVSNQLWQVYAAFVSMSIGWGTMSGAAINIIVAPWFQKRRGLAVSLALNGASAGGIVIAPLLILLIDRLGFATALSCVTAAMLAAIIPIATLILRRRRPGERDVADESDGEPLKTSKASTKPGPAWQISRVASTGKFQATSAAFALGLMAQVGFLTHQVGYLSPLLGSEGAGWAVGITTSSAVLGRVLTGTFIDKVNRRVAASGNFLIQVIGMILLMEKSSAGALYLGCVLFGLGVGNMISFPGIIVQQDFPEEYFARTISLIVSINQFTFAFGPALLGYLQRATGSYTPALLACAMMEAAAAAIVLLPLMGPTFQWSWRKGTSS